MTLNRNLRELHTRLSNIQRCAELAPADTYECAKSAANAIDEAIEAVRAVFREHGFEVNNNDPCRDLEAAIYGYLLISNPERYGLITGEGFGEHIDGSAGERIMANTIRDRDAFQHLTGQ